MTRRPPIPMRGLIRAACETVFAEITEALGPSRAFTDYTPVFLAGDNGDHWRLSCVWFPRGKNRGIGVDDYLGHAVVRAWAHDGTISSIELVCQEIPDVALLRSAAQAVGLLPRSQPVHEGYEPVAYRAGADCCDDCGVLMERHGTECGYEIGDPASGYFESPQWVSP